MLRHVFGGIFGLTWLYGEYVLFKPLFNEHYFETSWFYCILTAFTSFGLLLAAVMAYLIVIVAFRPSTGVSYRCESKGDSGRNSTPSSGLVTGIILGAVLEDSFDVID